MQLEEICRLPHLLSISGVGPSLKFWIPKSSSSGPPFAGWDPLFSRPDPLFKARDPPLRRLDPPFLSFWAVKTVGPPTVRAGPPFFLSRPRVYIVNIVPAESQIWARVGESRFFPANRPPLFFPQLCSSRSQQSFAACFGNLGAKVVKEIDFIFFGFPPARRVMFFGVADCSLRVIYGSEGDGSMGSSPRRSVEAQQRGQRGLGATHPWLPLHFSAARAPPHCCGKNVAEGTPRKEVKSREIRLATLASGRTTDCHPPAVPRASPCPGIHLNFLQILVLLDNSSTLSKQFG